MKLYYISWVPAAAVMILIFCFSAKPADTSGQNSMAVARTVISYYESISGNQVAEASKPQTLEAVDHYVRKTAHFCEYALLAGTIILHLLALKSKGKVIFFVPVIIAGIYAITDEYHQTFVAGRSGRVSDVLLDTAGALTGAIIFCLIIYMIRRRVHKETLRKQ